MSYRNDPEWQQAQTEYVSRRGSMTPFEALMTRNAAAHRMFDIETNYETRNVA